MRPFHEGKTMINSMINYIFGVKSEDEFRFQLREDIQEETSHVSNYKIGHSVGMRIPYSLTIVEVVEDAIFLEENPGPDMVRQLIESDHGIEEVDLVSVMFQPWKFNATLSVLGNNLRANANFIATKSQVPDVGNKDFKHMYVYKIKNEDYFQSNRLDDLNKVMHEFETFFTQLATMKTISLGQTKSVLEDRKRVESALEELRSLIRNGIATKEKLRDEQKNEQRIVNNIQEIAKKMLKKNDCRQVTLQQDQTVLNCKECQVTCMKSITYTTWGFTQNCRVCPRKCKSDTHFVENFKWEKVPFPCNAELQQNMSSENNSLKAAYEHINQLEKEVDKIENSVKKRVDFLHEGVKKFKENALGDAFWSNIEDILAKIEAENDRKQPGLEARIDQLQKIFTRSEILSRVNDKPSVLELIV